MHGGRVKRLGTIADAQKSGCLLKGPGSNASHLLQLVAGREAAMFVAELHDVQRHALRNAGDVAEQRPGGCVEIDTDLVDAGLDRGIERLLQQPLIDIVLVLADADRLWIDLDELRKRVLQASSDGNGSAYGEVEVGELPGGLSRRRSKRLRPPPKPSR